MLTLVSLYSKYVCIFSPNLIIIQVRFHRCFKYNYLHYDMGDIGCHRSRTTSRWAWRYIRFSCESSLYFYTKSLNEINHVFIFLFFLQDVVLIAVGIGAIFSLLFHCGVDEVKHNQVYHSNKNESNSPSAMKAFDWLKEKQFYQVRPAWHGFWLNLCSSWSVTTHSHDYHGSVCMEFQFLFEFEATKGLEASLSKKRVWSGLCWIFEIETNECVTIGMPHILQALEYLIAVWAWTIIAQFTGDVALGRKEVFQNIRKDLRSIISTEFLLRIACCAFDFFFRPPDLDW